MQLAAPPSELALRIEQRSLFERRWVQLYHSAQPGAIDIDFFDARKICLRRS